MSCFRDEYAYNHIGRRTSVSENVRRTGRSEYGPQPTMSQGDSSELLAERRLYVAYPSVAARQASIGEAFEESRPACGRRTFEPPTISRRSPQAFSFSQASSPATPGVNTPRVDE